MRGRLVGKAGRGHEEHPDKVWMRNIYVVGVYYALIVRYEYPVMYTYFLVLCSMRFTHLRYPSNVPVDWYRPHQGSPLANSTAG